MAQESHLSRFHPAVLSVAGLGAAYGIYALYSAYSQRPASTLHRSNAVHRPRRERGNRLASHAPTTDAPLGTISVCRNGAELLINLATTQVPGADQFGAILGPGADELRREVQQMVLGRILTTLASATPGSETWSVAEDFGLRDTLSALHATPPDRRELERALWAVRRIMNLDLLTPEDLEESVIFAMAVVLTHPSISDVEIIDPPETEDLDAVSSINQREPSQGLRGLLYYIAEDNAKRNAYEHRGIHCEECGQHPITGIRWHCLNCPDYDLCSSCETHTRHPQTHVFAKIKIPLPVLSQPTKEYPIWYPGDPRRVHSSLEPGLRKRFANDYHFEEPQIDALYDQFLTVANVPWENDPSKVRAAIDRRAFNKALTSERWSSGLSTNAMFDRMFAFYDTDNNGIIGLEEFLSAMAYLRGPKRYATLERALQGYDLDGDGYVDRTDFLRLLRAKFAIQKQLVHDSIEGQQMERTQTGLGILRSSQPISSMFAQEDIPPGETRRPRGKQPDVFGDLQPVSGTKSLLGEQDPFHRIRVPAAHEQLRSHLARIEDMMYSTGNAGEPLPPSGSVNIATDVTDTRQENLDTGLSRVFDISKMFSDHEYETEEPYVQDALWHVIEQGFNDLLDGVFKDKEEEDQMIISTRDERTKWREQIDAQIATDHQSREQLLATAATDPLMGTAMGSCGIARNNTIPPEFSARPRRQVFDNLPVPTSWNHLTEREAEISGAILNDLLQVTGYGVRYDSQIERRFDDRLSSSSKSEGMDNEKFDPTSPHKPNSAIDAPSNEGLKGPGCGSESKAPQSPSQQRLQHLSRLDALEREMYDRGGPGRLSYDEVERITVADSKGELRGLVKSWLEWAAF